MMTESKPAGFLDGHVKRIVRFDCGEFSAPYQFKFFADGCPGIMFQEGQNPMLVNSTNDLATVVLYGQTVMPMVVSTKGTYRIVVAVLYPDALEYLFGIPANHLTDTCLDLNLLNVGKEFSLADKMLNAATEGQRVEIMEDFIFKLILGKKFQPKNEIRRAISLIHEGNGNKKIIDIARELRISERTLMRQFEQRVGVAPKVYSSIWKFQSAVERLQHGKFDSLSGLAYELGYADQSHFNRWFKLFTGETPVQYLNNIGVVNSGARA
jgi:AraC-like DNA-binding protein